MPVTDVEPLHQSAAQHTAAYRFGAVWLFLLLSAYSVSTFDDSPLQRYFLGGVTLLFCLVFLAIGFRQRLRFSVPAVCVLLMSAYGAAQTLWFPQKIVFYGWVKTVYWLTAALIALVATQVFQSPRLARQFRVGFAFLASGVALLDLLQQASHSTKYFWIYQSRWQSIYGTFAYHNNFAQLIELSLPITLWLGIGHRRPNLWFVFLGALQVGAVAAASSRAGLALVFAELIAVSIIAWFRHGQASVLTSLGITLALSLVFVFVAGFEGVAQKLRGDQLLVRREINRSSLAMIEERPLTGWGLGTYVPVYPMFARYDDGTYVNQAHNDWLEWAAEGGIPFAAIMLVVFVWTVVPAARSVWGIGLIAVGLNALVDYPFARLGVCGWYFALAGMLAAGLNQETSATRKLRRASHE